MSSRENPKCAASTVVKKRGYSRRRLSRIPYGFFPRSHSQELSNKFSTLLYYFGTSTQYAGAMILKFASTWRVLMLTVFEDKQSSVTVVLEIILFAVRCEIRILFQCLYFVERSSGQRVLFFFKLCFWVWALNHFYFTNEAWRKVIFHSCFLLISRLRLSIEWGLILDND